MTHKRFYLKLQKDNYKFSSLKLLYQHIYSSIYSFNTLFYNEYITNTNLQCVTI